MQSDGTVTYLACEDLFNFMAGHLSLNRPRASARARGRSLFDAAGSRLTPHPRPFLPRSDKLTMRGLDKLTMRGEGRCAERTPASERGAGRGMPRPYGVRVRTDTR